MDLQELHDLHVRTMDLVHLTLLHRNDVIGRSGWIAVAVLMLATASLTDREKKWAVPLGAASCFAALILAFFSSSVLGSRIFDTYSSACWMVLILFALTIPIAERPECPPRPLTISIRLVIIFVVVFAFETGPNSHTAMWDGQRILRNTSGPALALYGSLRVAFMTLFVLGLFALLPRRKEAFLAVIAGAFAAAGLAAALDLAALEFDWLSWIDPPYSFTFAAICWAFALAVFLVRALLARRKRLPTAAAGAAYPDAHHGAGFELPIVRWQKLARSTAFQSCLLASLQPWSLLPGYYSAYLGLAVVVIASLSLIAYLVLLPLVQRKRDALLAQIYVGDRALVPKHFLYLRSFDTGWSSWLGRLSFFAYPFLSALRSTRRFDFEEELADALNGEGLLIAIGDRRQSFGAAKLRTTDADWKRHFDILATGADLIFFAPGVSSGADWELAQISARPELLEKTIWVMPWRLRARDWDETTAKAFRQFKLEFPAHRKEGVLYLLDAAGRVSQAMPLDQFRRMIAHLRNTNQQSTGAEQSASVFSPAH